MNVEEIVTLKKFEPVDDLIQTVPQWPMPLGKAAFHGLAGEITHSIEPNTEGDPTAILLQFLTAYGNAIGRKAHYLVEATEHFTNIYICLVGQTASGRKGTSWDHVFRIFKTIGNGNERPLKAWLDRIFSGLSTGEGVIEAVRDPVWGKTRNKKTKQDEEIMLDPGVSDKRLLIQEAEFARVLQVMKREGATLSAILREGWDRGTLRVLTRNSKLIATGAHLSLVGHITKEELCRHLQETEMANGLCNRILWVCVKRSKFLPDGGNISKVDWRPIILELCNAVDFGSKAGRLTRDDEARELWHAVYPRLSEGKRGLFGAITARAAPQVLRLSCLYALLDRSETIRREHLEAALEVWRYCEDSAAFIFGNNLGDPEADELLRALKQAGSDGLSRTEISKRFHHHKKPKEIGRALNVLLESGLANYRRQSSDGGRPVEIWHAQLSTTPHCEISEISEISPPIERIEENDAGLNSHNSLISHQSNTAESEEWEVGSL